MPLLVGGDSLIPSRGFTNYYYPPESVDQTVLLNKLPLHSIIASHDWKKSSLYNVIPNCYTQWQSILPITRLQQLTLGNKATDVLEKQLYPTVVVGNPNRRAVHLPKHQQFHNKNSVSTTRKEDDDTNPVKLIEKSFECKSVIKCSKSKTFNAPSDKKNLQDIPKEVQCDKDPRKNFKTSVETNFLSTRKRSSSWPGDMHLKMKFPKKNDGEKQNQIYKNLEMDVANILVSDIPFAVIGLHHGKDVKEGDGSIPDTADKAVDLCQSDQENNATKVLFTCQQCAITCNSTEELLSHNSKHNTSNNFVLTCNVCSQVFRSTSGLQKHVEFHGDDNHRHSCSFCFQPFQSKDSLEEHIVNMHMSKRPHKCTYCPKAFRDPGSLQKHIRVHTGEKPYHCTSCEKSFAEYSSLRKHLRVHTGEQPYKCKFCPKAFSISGNLQRHILIHTGERPYKCSNCNKAFNNPSHLRRHVKNLHSKLETEK